MPTEVYKSGSFEPLFNLVGVCCPYPSMSTLGRPRKNPAYPPPPAETLGDRLRAERARLGYTQVQLAEALGVAERAIKNYEQDRNAIRMLILEKLGRLGFDIDFLIFGNDRPKLEPLDEQLWDRLVAWADANCVDEKKQPLNAYAKYQRITTLYRWLKSADGDGADVEARLEALSTRAA